MERPGAWSIPALHPGSSVVAPLLNWPEDLQALGATAEQPPYKARPRAPVLYLRPRNTWAADGDDIVLPPGVDALQVGASLAAVIGRSACRVSIEDALDVIAGWTIVNDLCVPHTSFYRPAMAQRCRDGTCPIASPVARGDVGDVDVLEWHVFVDDERVAQGSLAGAVRPMAHLLADISEFMTLHPGDLLLLGSRSRGPTVRAGQFVRIEIDGLGSLGNRCVAESRAA